MLLHILAQINAKISCFHKKLKELDRIFLVCRRLTESVANSYRQNNVFRNKIPAIRKCFGMNGNQKVALIRTRKVICEESSCETRITTDMQDFIDELIKALFHSIFISCFPTNFAPSLFLWHKCLKRRACGSHTRKYSKLALSPFSMIWWIKQKLFP